MTIEQATLILRRRPQSRQQKRACRAALTVLGFENLPLSVIEGDVTRSLTLAEIALIDAARPTHAA